MGESPASKQFKQDSRIKGHKIIRVCFKLPFKSLKILEIIGKERL